MQTNGIAQGASILSVLETLKRRKFYILVPALALTPCVVAFVSRLPDWYRAQALLAVEQAAASEYLRGPAMLDRPDIQEQFRVIRETLLAPEGLTRENIQGLYATLMHVCALQGKWDAVFSAQPQVKSYRTDISSRLTFIVPPPCALELLWKKIRPMRCEPYPDIA